MNQSQQNIHPGYTEVHYPLAQALDRVGHAARIAENNAQSDAQIHEINARIAESDALIAELNTQIAANNALIAELAAGIAQQQAQIYQLQAEIAARKAISRRRSHLFQNCTTFKVRH
jgi:peptidoglycan hydrolase CwlO-like protein